VAQLLRGAWQASIEREGLAPVARASAEACPACGATQELVDGACPDCGLQLA
jgi:predicted RNA-binding Zn-ribbon protein involved in translation (DUF1610 family)